MEALIGVVIGCVIGNVVAITILVVEHRRWKKEFKLQYSITERARREKQCDRIIELLKKGPFQKDIYPLELLVNVLLRLPKDVSSLIKEACKDIDHSQPEGRQKQNREVSFILGIYLGEIDKQIEELTQ